MCSERLAYDDVLPFSIVCVLKRTSKDRLHGM